MRRTGRTAVAVLATVALGLGACSGDDDDGQLSVDLDASSTSSTATSIDPGIGDPAPFPETATSLGIVPDDLPDGTYFGYITTLLAGDMGISGQFDLAELLTGPAAVAAAEAAGQEPLDFFIKNDNDKLRPIVVAADAEVRDIDYENCCQALPTTVTDFIAERDANEEQRTTVAITVADGLVTQIDEIYFP